MPIPRRTRFVGLLLLAGCQIAAPEVNTEADIAAVTGFADAVSFRVEGGPVDVGRPDFATLELADALRAALESDPRLQAALARVRVAQAEAELAGLLPNPVLNLVVRLPEGGGQALLEAGLGADLLAILQQPGRASAAGHRLRAASANALSMALDVVAELQEQYIQVQSLEARLPVLTLHLDLFARLRDVAQARLEAGEGTRHEVTALDSERTRLEVEFAQRRRELRVARLNLARRIGEPSSAANWQLEAWSAPSAISSDERSWLDAALAARPELLAVAWEIKARQAEEALARGQRFEGATLGVDGERDDDWSLGPALALPLPIFDTGSLRGVRAEALTAEERHHLTEAQRGVIEQTRAALTGVVGAQTDLQRVTAELLPIMEQRRGEIAAAYRLGHVDITALLLADQALQSAHLRRLELEQETTVALSRLQRAVGGAFVYSAVQSAVQETQP
ncbi:MAG: TolC family protein [Planctomycetota bacterium]